MKTFLSLLLLSPLFCIAQKKVLDHTVYDGWQSVAEKKISNDGRFVAYTVNPQEGDGVMYVKTISGKLVHQAERGYLPMMSEDSRYLVYKIKPYYKEVRTARIKKKKPDEMPKDSVGILQLAGNSAVTPQLYSRVKSFKMPAKKGNFLAILFEKAEEKGKANADSSKIKVDKKTDNLDADEEAKPDSKKDEGGDLLLKNLVTGEEKMFKNVLEFIFNDYGNKLLLETAAPKKDSLAKPTVQLLDLATGQLKTIMRGLNDAKGFSMDEEGKQLAFVAERDSAANASKYYKLWFYTDGKDSVEMIADKKTKGIRNGWGINENAAIEFSKTGKRLMFGTGVILPPKDTTVPEIDRVSVDVWSYKDDYLQTQQLRSRDRDEKRSYLAMYDWNDNKVIQLANEWIQPVYATMEGDGKHFYGVTDSGMRAASQWQGFTVKRVYHINQATGATTVIRNNFKGNAYPSSTGKYLLMYDEREKQYSLYDGDAGTTAVISKDIPFPLFDEDNDVPDDPNPYGIVKWMKDDKAVLIYDRYDIWQVDPTRKQKPINLTGGVGRKNKIQYRFLNVDEDEKFITPAQSILLSAYNEINKSTSVASMKAGVPGIRLLVPASNERISGVVKAKDNDVIIYTKENYKNAPDLFSFIQDNAKLPGTNNQEIAAGENRLTTINSQQANYNWGTAELFKWTAYTGKLTEGIVYKPENFDPKKKYPMIVYFYERGNQGLHNYIPPAPTPSRLNISFFVSRGYIVFVPDIWYTKGHPGKSAYDYILSGTRAVVKQGYVDSTKIGLQGQSWGGYQIAHLVTRTNLYAAAWAGAPVANMTSAYGGIRWGTGVNRQFQYEKTQSRIGATLWEKPELYIENSPLFHLPKVKTPMVIMANDADDAVPWYQGIELFTGLRRLGKPVWMLNYNNEAHNLVERKNRKDISIREQQFFDWLLKGEKPARWLSDGVPAIYKGRDLGL